MHTMMKWTSLGLLLVPQLAFATVTATVSDNALSITADDSGNTITVTCAASNVQVNGVDPSSGPVACASLSSITVQGGAGGDTIDLSGVARSEFAAATAVSITGGDGDDTITGSPFDDTITGGAGNNWIDGGVGNDSLTLGSGNDIVYGNLGDDTFYLTTSSGGRYLDGGTGNDTIVVTGSAGNDTISIVVMPPNPAMNNEVDSDIALNGITTKTAFFESYQISMGDGDDTATLQIPPGAALQVHGEGGNNTLTFDTQCAQNTLTPTSFTETGALEADFDGFGTPQVTDALAFGSGEVDVTANATSASVDLSAGSCSWVATSDSAWLTVSQSSGTGSATLALVLTPNTGTDARTGHITADAATVAVVQAGTASPNPPVGPTGNPSAGGSSTSGAGGGAAPSTATTTKHGCAETTPEEVLGFAALFGALFISRRRSK